MKCEQAHQPLHCAPFLPPHPKKSEMLLQTTHSCSSVSYKVQRPGYWEDLQFNNTSMLASWGLWFLKEKVASQREKERDKERKRERENTSIELHRERFARRLEQIFRDGGESGCRGGRDGRGRGRQAEVRSHVHHHLFVYIETADHLETDGDTLLIKCCYRQKGATVKNKYNQWWLNSI